MTEKDESMNVTEAMLHIKSIDRGAHLQLSDWTREWMVSARIEISDGACLTSPNEHRRNPNDAVVAYFRVLQEVDTQALDRVIVTTAEAGGGRRHLRWNGAAFAQEPVQRFRDSVRR